MHHASEPTAWTLFTPHTIPNESPRPLVILPAKKSGSSAPLFAARQVLPHILPHFPSSGLGAADRSTTPSGKF